MMERTLPHGCSDRAEQIRCIFGVSSGSLLIRHFQIIVICWSQAQLNPIEGSDCLRLKGDNSFVTKRARLIAVVQWVQISQTEKAPDQQNHQIVNHAVKVSSVNLQVK